VPRTSNASHLTLEPVTDAVLIGGCLLTHPGGPRAFGL